MKPSEPIVNETIKRLSEDAPEWPVYNWEVIEFTAPHGTRNRALIVTTNTGDDRGPMHIFIPFSITSVVDEDGQLRLGAHQLIIDAHADMVAAA